MSIADQIKAYEAEKIAKAQEAAVKQQKETEQAALKEAEKNKSTEPEKTAAAIEAEKIAEAAKQAEQQKKDAEKAAREAKAAKEAKEADELKRLKALGEKTQQHNEQVAFTKLIQEMRESDKREVQQIKADRAAEKAATKEAPAKNGPKLERGDGNEKPREHHAADMGDIRGMQASLDSGHQRLSKSTVINDYSHEHDLIKAGSEHTHGGNQVTSRATQPSQEAQAEVESEKAPEAEKPAPVAELNKDEPEPEVKKAVNEPDIDQRMGAEAIPSTQAAKNRDEMNMEAGKGYRETPADQVTEERVRDGDGFDDKVPTHPEAAKPKELELPPPPENERTPEPEIDLQDDFEMER